MLLQGTTIRNFTK